MIEIIKLTTVANVEVHVFTSKIIEMYRDYGWCNGRGATIIYMVDMDTPIMAIQTPEQIIEMLYPKTINYRGPG